MQVNQTHNYQYALATLNNLRDETLSEEKRNLEEVNNAETKRIREEIKTSAITGLGQSLNIKA